MINICPSEKSNLLKSWLLVLLLLKTSQWCTTMTTETTAVTNVSATNSLEKAAGVCSYFIDRSLYAATIIWAGKSWFAHQWIGKAIARERERKGKYLAHSIWLTAAYTPLEVCSQCLVYASDTWKTPF